MKTKSHSQETKLKPCSQTASNSSPDISKEQILKDIKNKHNGSVRDYLLSKGKFKDDISKEQEICYQCPICPYCYDDHNNFDRCKESFENGIKQGRKDAIEEEMKSLEELRDLNIDSVTVECFIHARMLELKKEIQCN